MLFKECLAQSKAVEPPGPIKAEEITTHDGNGNAPAENALEDQGEQS